jgi:hypothetical protein
MEWLRCFLKGKEITFKAFLLHLALGSACPAVALPFLGTFGPLLNADREGYRPFQLKQ